VFRLVLFKPSSGLACNITKVTRYFTLICVFKIRIFVFTNMCHTHHIRYTLNVPCAICVFVWCSFRYSFKFQILNLSPVAFCTRPDRPWCPPGLLYNVYRVFRWVKRPGRGVDHPPPPSADIKERVELYLHSPSGPSWTVLGWPVLYL